MRILLKFQLLHLLLLADTGVSAQTSKFNYDRHMMGMAGYLTYYYPKKPDKDSFQFDKGGVSSEFIFHYQWKNKTLFTPYLGWLTRTAEFRYPARFQTNDQFLVAGFLAGKRLYVVDHALFADMNMGLSMRKLVNRKYRSEYPNPMLVNSLPVDKSMWNSLTGGFVTDLKLHFELKGSGMTFYAGINSTTDLFKLGNSKFNEFTRKYNSVSLAIGFTSF